MIKIRLLLLPLLLCLNHARAQQHDRFWVTGYSLNGLPPYLANGDVAAGTLVRILPRFQIETGAVYLVQPGRKLVPQRVAAFRALLLELLRQRPLDPE